MTNDVSSQVDTYMYMYIHVKLQIEFLREELRQTKAKLAESEFYREQAQLELK